MAGEKWNDGSMLNYSLLREQQNHAHKVQVKKEIDLLKIKDPLLFAFTDRIVLPQSNTYEAVESSSKHQDKNNSNLKF